MRQKRPYSMKNLKTELWLRARAYDVLCIRDGLGGWHAGRAAFRADRRLKRGALRRECELRIRRILHHAFRTSPYYATTWKEVGFNPNAADITQELIRLPFLTKQVIRDRKAQLISREYSRRELKQSLTGGTTGAQTSFYLDDVCATRRLGRQWGALELCGYQPGMRRGLLWGVHSDFASHEAPATLRKTFRTFAAGDAVMGCTIMDAAGMRDYHRRLSSFKPQVLYGYPSALEQLAQFIADESLERITVEALITTAERLTESTRSKLEESFGGQVFNLYCTREYGCVAHECHVHKGLHLDTGSVYVEIVADGVTVPPGQLGEIAITDLMNRGMPFIRSRTGDLGILSPEPCPCGSPFPLLKSLQGRETDVVHLPNGSKLAGMMLTDLFIDMPGVRYMQFVQKTIDELDVAMVATPEFTADVERAAVEEIRALVGPQMKISLQRVSEIPRSKNSGKLQEVISLLSVVRDR